MSITVEAIYENGMLRLKEPVPLADSTSVRVTIVANEAQSAPPGADGQSAAKWLATIASLPIEPGGQEFSGRDHDRILYGPKGAR